MEETGRVGGAVLSASAHVAHQLKSNVPAAPATQPEMLYERILQYIERLNAVAQQLTAHADKLGFTRDIEVSTEAPPTTYSPNLTGAHAELGDRIDSIEQQVSRFS